MYVCVCTEELLYIYTHTHACVSVCVCVCISARDFNLIDSSKPSKWCKNVHLDSLFRFFNKKGGCVGRLFQMSCTRSKELQILPNMWIFSHFLSNCSTLSNGRIIKPAQGGITHTLLDTPFEKSRYNGQQFWVPDCSTRFSWRMLINEPVRLDQRQCDEMPPYKVVEFMDLPKWVIKLVINTLHLAVLGWHV